MKIAIVHYWLVGMRGGEKVVEALCEIYPEADIFTHVVDHSKLSDTINSHSIYTTFINRLPWAKRLYQLYLPLMPMALEQLDLSNYDLVISSESGPAKGVVTRPDATHICYCHTPMRYAWDMYHEYLKQKNGFLRFFMRPLLHYIRLWDFQSAARVDYFISNSNYVAARIDKYYRRQASVIHPPVDTQAFLPSNTEPEDYYLLLGQLVPYKKADVAIQAFNQLNKPLVVIGTGEQELELKKMANDNIKFLGWQKQEVIVEHLQNCRALVFPGVEDFGIVPLEAMASGTPVIAYRQGGALETVIDGSTGLFFDAQTPESLTEAVMEFESKENGFDKQAMLSHTAKFSKQNFKNSMREFIQMHTSNTQGSNKS